MIYDAALCDSAVGMTSRHFYADNLAASILACISWTSPLRYSHVQDMLQKWICSIDGTAYFTPQGRAWNPLAPTLGATGNTAFLAAIYGQMSSTAISAAQSARYVCFARSQMRYIMGDNRRSLMVGFGLSSPSHVQVSHHILMTIWHLLVRHKSACMCHERRLLQNFVSSCAWFHHSLWALVILIIVCCRCPFASVRICKCPAQLCSIPSVTWCSLLLCVPLAPNTNAHGASSFAANAGHQHQRLCQHTDM